MREAVAGGKWYSHTLPQIYMQSQCKDNLICHYKYANIILYCRFNMVGHYIRDLLPSCLLKAAYSQVYKCNAHPCQDALRYGIHELFLEQVIVFHIKLLFRLYYTKHISYFRCVLDNYFSLNGQHNVVPKFNLLKYYCPKPQVH